MAHRAGPCRLGQRDNRVAQPARALAATEDERRHGDPAPAAAGQRRASLRALHWRQVVGQRVCGGLQPLSTSASGTIATKTRGSAPRSSAARGVSQSAARLGQPRRRQSGDSPPERLTSERMDVVEGDNAIGRNTIVGRSKHELRYQPSLRSRQSGDDHGSGPIGDGIARQHQHRTIATGRRREPDLTSLHVPNRPSPQPDPSLRPPTEIARPRSAACAPRRRHHARW